MAFTVEDFHDLIELLGQRPEWRADLRRHVLSDDLLEIPALVRQLVEAQVRTESRLDRLEASLERLVEAQMRTESRLDRLEASVQRLVEAQARTDQNVADLVVAQRLAGDRLGTLEGDALEWKYARHAPSYFGRIVRRLRVLEPVRLVDLLDDAVDNGRMTWAERDSILLADLVMSGRHRESDQDVYLLAEVSVGVGQEDVQRAIDRATLLEKLGRPVLPIVAGRWINTEARDLAQGRGVWTHELGRRLTAPEAG